MTQEELDALALASAEKTDQAKMDALYGTGLGRAADSVALLNEGREKGTRDFINSSPATNYPGTDIVPAPLVVLDNPTVTSSPVQTAPMPTAPAATPAAAPADSGGFLDWLRGINSAVTVPGTMEGIAYNLGALGSKLSPKGSVGEALGTLSAQHAQGKQYANAQQSLLESMKGMTRAAMDPTSPVKMTADGRTMTFKYVTPDGNVVTEQSVPATGDVSAGQSTGGASPVQSFASGGSMQLPTIDQRFLTGLSPEQVNAIMTQGLGWGKMMNESEAKHLEQWVELRKAQLAAEKEKLPPEYRRWEMGQQNSAFRARFPDYGTYQQYLSAPTSNQEYLDMVASDKGFADRFKTFAAWQESGEIPELRAYKAAREQGMTKLSYDDWRAMGSVPGRVAAAATAAKTVERSFADVGKEADQSLNRRAQTDMAFGGRLNDPAFRERERAKELERIVGKDHKGKRVGYRYFTEDGVAKKGIVDLDTNTPLYSEPR